jgi:hypothetical protein
MPIPATTSAASDALRSAIAADDKAPARSRPHCSNVAPAAKPVQTKRYPIAKKAPRAASAGAAPGSIIATIMTAHMAKTSSAWPADHADAISGMSGICGAIPAPCTR